MRGHSATIMKDDDERERGNVVWGIRIDEEEKAYLVRVTKEHGKTAKDFFTHLVNSMKSGAVVYDDEGFHAPKKEIIVSKYSDETKQIEFLSARVERLENENGVLKDKLEIKESLLECVRETIREELRDAPKKEKSENFPENKKGDIDLTGLIMKAREKQITPQSLLDTMLKRNR